MLPAPRLDRDTMVVACHLSWECHPARELAVGIYGDCPVPSPCCLQCHQRSVTPVTRSVTATGTEVLSPLPGQGLMDPGLPRTVQHRVRLSPYWWGYWWDWVPLTLYLPVGLGGHCYAHLPCPCGTPGIGGSIVGASRDLPRDSPQLHWQHQAGTQGCTCALCTDGWVLAEPQLVEVGTCPWASLALRHSWDRHCGGCHVPASVWNTLSAESQLHQCQLQL